MTAPPTATVAPPSAAPSPPVEPGLATLREAIPYIAAHRDRTVVLALGGEAALSPRFPALLTEIVELSALGLHVVLVHGARPQISARLTARGLTERFHQGLRVTDPAAMDAVCDAVGRLRLDIERGLSRSIGTQRGLRHRVRVAGGNFVFAQPIGVRDGVDFGDTGRVSKVDVDGLRRLLDDDRIVVASPLGYSATGDLFNVSGEEVATRIAVELGADKLVFLTATDALRAGAQADTARLPSQLTVVDVERILDEHTRQTRALPEELAAHLASARDALAAREMRVHLVDREAPSALLRELFTRDGAGTLVTREPIERLRPATLDDVSGIAALIAPLEAEGVLVPRPRERLELEIGHYRVLDLDGLIVGTAALYPYPASGMAELACLALHADFRGAGRGDRLLDAVSAEARACGCPRLFVLTTHTGQWFRERGFEPAQRDDLPPERRERLNLARNSRILVRDTSSR